MRLLAITFSISLSLFQSAILHAAESYGAPWRDFKQTTKDRTVYLSCDGDDLNSGLSPSSPKKTFNSAWSLIRSGFGDHLRFHRVNKAGSRCTYGNETFGGGSSGIYLNKSGASSARRLLIGSYPQASKTLPRPIIRKDTGISAPGNKEDTKYVKNIVIEGIEFQPSEQHYLVGVTNNAAAFFWGSQQNIWVQDTYSSGFKHNFAFQGNCDNPIVNVGFVGNISVDSYHKMVRPITNIVRNDASSGLYLSCVKDSDVRMNLFDRNGIVRGVPVHTYNHQVYIQTGNTGILNFQYNIMSDGDGIQARSPMTFANNLGLRLAQNIFRAEGSDSKIYGNVIMYGRDLDVHTDGNVTRAWGIRLGGANSKTKIERNYFLDDQSADAAPPIWINISGFFNEKSLASNPVRGWGPNRHRVDRYDSSGKMTSSAMITPARQTCSLTQDMAMSKYMGVTKRGFETFIARARTLQRGRWIPTYTAGPVLDFVKGCF